MKAGQDGLTDTERVEQRIKIIRAEIDELQAPYSGAFEQMGYEDYRNRLRDLERYLAQSYRHRNRLQA